MSRAPDPEAPAISRSYVVVLRLLLLGLAVAAVVVAVVIAGRGRGGDGGSGVSYVCPMHPEVKASAPGQCPICRMALEPVTRGPGQSPHPAMGGMVDLTAVENVRKHKILDFVRVHSLLPNLRELRGAAWVDGDRSITAIYYDDQIEVLDPDEAGTFTPTGSPSTSFAVRRTSDPVTRWDASTSRVRFRAGAGTALEPGQVGWLEIPRKPRDVLGVPTSALLQSPQGPYVLRSLGGGRFEKRPVEIGETFIKQGFAVVLSGLQKHDLVVSRAAFFVDADRRLGNAVAEAGMAAAGAGSAPAEAGMAAP